MVLGTLRDQLLYPTWAERPKTAAAAAVAVAEGDAGSSSSSSNGSSGSVNGNGKGSVFGNVTAGGKEVTLVSMLRVLGFTVRRGL
jgi:hypothetical protein